MGGENEKVIPAAKSSSGKSGVTAVASLRVHENRSEGKVHFHDDARKLRVAVPTAVFFRDFAGWKSTLTDASHNLVFTDLDAGTMVEFEPSISESGVMDVSATISAIKVGPALKALDDFAQGK